MNLIRNKNEISSDFNLINPLEKCLMAKPPLIESAILILEHIFVKPTF